MKKEADKNLTYVKPQVQSDYCRGLKHTACGPLDAFVRPANTSKNDKSIKLNLIQLTLRAFLVNCCPQNLFSYKLRRSGHFSTRIWPSDQFEFETPGLQHALFIVLLCGAHSSEKNEFFGNEKHGEKCCILCCKQNLKRYLEYVSCKTQEEIWIFLLINIFSNFFFFLSGRNIIEISFHELYHCNN